MRGEEGAGKYAYFRRALERHGLPSAAAPVQECSLPGDAHQAADRFLGRSPLPEAVFVDNYQKAVFLVQFAQSRGLSVPKDFAVMAYGTETPGAALPLSHMAVPYAAMGREASLVLDQLIRGRVEPPVERIVRARLILRESCGCKPAGVVASADFGLRNQQTRINRKQNVVTKQEGMS